MQVEDQLIAGLTARQLLRLMIGASLAYAAWDQLNWLPEDIRLALAAMLAIVGVLFALVQPGGRPLDQWLVAGLLFVALPRRLVW
ncbi:MAG TPA: PrgI family protein [Chloroflexota bacterium]